MLLGLVATGKSQVKPIAFSLLVFLCTQKQNESTNASSTDRWHQNTDKINQDLWHRLYTRAYCFNRQQNMATPNVISNSNHHAPGKKCQRAGVKRVYNKCKGTSNRTWIKCNNSNETYIQKKNWKQYLWASKTATRAIVTQGTVNTACHNELEVALWQWLAKNRWPSQKQCKSHLGAAELHSKIHITLDYRSVLQITCNRPQSVYKKRFRVDIAMLEAPWILKSAA